MSSHPFFATSQNHSAWSRRTGSSRTIDPCNVTGTTISSGLIAGVISIPSWYFVPFVVYDLASIILHLATISGICTRTHLCVPVPACKDDANASPLLSKHDLTRPNHDI